MGTSSEHLYTLAELRGNAPVRLDALQQLLLPYHHYIHAAWVAIWFITLAYVLVTLYSEYRQSEDA